MLIFVTLATLALGAQDRRIPMDSGWQLSGEGSRIETIRGTRAIQLRTGRAIRRDVSFQDGTIEFDMLVTPNRSFVYLHFRMTADGEHEEIYFRPHKSTLPDAVQYTPVWNEDSNWQLYHGPGATAAVPFTHDQWMHVRIVVSGRRAALFLGTAAEPALVMTLGRAPVPGYIGLGAFTPRGGAPDGVMTGSFANVVLHPERATFDFPAVAAESPPPGLVRRWQLSAPFVARAGAMTEIPDSLVRARGTWRGYDVEPTGVLVIGRHLERPAPLSGTIARLLLRAPADGVQPMRLGYSDYVTVFVNGRPLFSGDAHYSFDAPRQEGLIGLYQSTVWLPLRRGENEVLFAISDGFGGWGLMAQLDPSTGVQVVSPP